MHKFGSVMAFIFNKIFLIMLVLGIVGIIPLIGFSSTFTDREEVKKILAEADVYSTIPDNALKIAEFSSEDDANETNPFAHESAEVKTVYQVLDENDLIDPDELVATFKRTFDRDFLQTSVETVIDSFYDVLDGTTDELSFELTLSERSEVAEKEFKQFVTTSLEKMPVCSAGEIPDEDDFNLLEAPCLPPGANLQSEINSFIDELTADDGIFSETFTEEDLDVSEVDLVFAQITYEGFSNLVVIFWIMIVGLSAAAILTAGNIHRGFKVVGVMHFVLGLMLLIGFLAAPTAIDLAEIAVEDAGELTEQQLEAAENILKPLSEEMVDAVSARVVVVTSVLTVLGIISFAFGVILSRHHVEHLTLHGEAYKPETDPKTKDSELKEKQTDSAHKNTSDKADAEKKTLETKTTTKQPPTKKS